MTLDSPVRELRGVGDAVAKKLAQLGIKTVADLIDYYPRRYDDFSQLTPIVKLKPGPVTIQATVKQATGRYVRRGMHITEAVASDETSSVRLIWFNQPYRAAALKKEQQYYISGNFELSRQRFAIMNPSVELASEFPLNTARIIPIYKETKGLTSRQIRAALAQVQPLIETTHESLPSWMLEKYHLMNLAEAMLAIHFPESSQQLVDARRRLGFEEVFSIILASLMNKREIASEHAPPVKFDEKVAKDFVKHLPFKLTDAQRKVVWQIYQDLEKTQPMNRLVEGDVGAGKTVVAAMAAVMVLNADKQVALMAPTELLARQHANTIQSIVKPLGYGDEVGLLVGSMTKAQKEKARGAIKQGKLRFIVGTHALIQESVDMHELELIVIDEQHRFGVEQRKTLQAKAGHMPHVLHLTATPIPRSLALTLYGELDISILDAKPAERLPIKTEIIPATSKTKLYAAVDQQIETGRQAFVVCPLVSESAVLEAESAEKVYDRLSKHEFKHRRVGLLHGQLKADEKQKTMQAFVDGEIDLLVATTVIEVGVDVPNATIMLLENAERFGLSQIHQLRGRVGRSHYQGYCYLLLGDKAPASRRLEAVERTNDGFKLAELDLTLRGPGAIYGTMQHGQLDLRLVQLSDTRLLADAREAAEAFLERDNLLQYKQLGHRIKHLRAVTNLN
ncbi:ATP-dependent DNA helicase RecG [Candidatus Saccharibacteria bacterium]|nr:ATP-dependent DNA helicase RecG [Candidatus Saccharibacteria bacterium]